MREAKVSGCVVIHLIMAWLSVQTAKYAMICVVKQDRYTYFVNAFVNHTRVIFQRLVVKETSRIQVCIQTVTNQNFINNCAINRNVVVSPTIFCGKRSNNFFPTLIGE